MNLKTIANNIVYIGVIGLLLLLFSYISAVYPNLAILITILFVAAGLVFAKTMKSPYWGFLLLVFFLPFERIPSVDVGLMTLKINQLVAVITLVSWVLAIIFTKKKIAPNPLTWPLLLFLLACFVSIFQAGDISRAVQVFVFTAFTIVICFLVVNMLDTRNSLEKVCKVLFFSTFVVCLFATFQFLGDMAGLGALTGLKATYTKAVFGFPRVMAFSNEPLYLAAFLFIPLGLGFALYLQGVNIIKRNWLLFLLGFTLLIFILTVSRGAYIGLAGMALFFLVIMAKKVFTLRNMATIVAIALFAIGGTWLFLSKSETGSIDEFLSHITLQDIAVAESSVARLEAYQKAIDFWHESPIVGIGIGNYGPRYQGYPNSQDVDGWVIVNNQYLETLAETGVLGLATYLLIFIVLFWRTVIAYFKTKDQLLRACLIGLSAALIGILIQYNFFSTIYIMHIWFLIGLIIAVQNLSFAKSIKVQE